MTPDNHTEGDVEWTSDNTNVVTVSKIGPTNATYTAVAIGSAIITARVGEEMDTITITVIPNPTTNISIDQGEALSNVPGGRGPLTATVLPPDHGDGDVEWSSDNESFVTVSKIGPTNATYTAVAIGRATITARVGSETDTITITVIPNPATNIDIAQIDPISVVMGDTGPLTATVLPPGHTDGEVMWTSDNESFVTVSNIGSDSAVYTGVAIGRATITATVGSQMDTITVSVVSQVILATNIEIDQGEAITNITGEMGNVTAAVLPTNHTDGAITWISSDSKVVAINRFSGAYTAVEVGSATITAMVGTNNVRDTIAITVLDGRPPIISNHAFTVTENVVIGTLLGRVYASDNVAVTDYTILSGNVEGDFVINNLGELTTAGDIDHEDINNYTLVVEAPRR